MNSSDTDVQNLANKYEQNPDEVLPEIAEILKELNLQEPEEMSRDDNQLLSELISECIQRNPEHFRDNFKEHISGTEEEWFIGPLD